MKTSKLAHAIRLVLAAQVGATAMVVTPVALAQQGPVQQPASQPQVVYVQAPAANAQNVYPQAAYGQGVYAQSAYPAQQVPQTMYRQTPQQPVVYAQPQPAAQYPQGAYVAQPQVTYQPPTPQQQVMYAQPQPVFRQATPQPQMVYPQGAVMYPQNTQYGSVMQQPGANAYVQAGAVPQGAVVYQPSPAPVQQAPALVYQNGVPMQYPGGVVYGYSGQPPQGAVMYSNGMMVQPVAMNGMMVNGAAMGSTVVPATVGANDQLLADKPRLQTGSAGKLNTSASSVPVQTLTGDELRQVNAVNVESALNSLPQVIAGSDRTSNGTGRADVDLRGLGATRTAVLINGRRFVPSNSAGVVDLNAIPQALIKQVDVTTGGASVAYGSGAMAGAVNFVLDENYQGVELNVSHQGTPERDAGITSADLTLGTDFAEGRGNFAISVGGSEREGLLQGDREFSTFAQFDSSDANGNPILINGGSSGVPGTAIFSGALGGFSPSFGAIFDENGVLRPFETGEENDFYNYAQVNYLQLPQTREHATAIASFEVAESAELYALGMYSATETQRQQAPTPIFQTSQFTIDDSPFIDPSSQAVLSGAFGNGIDTDGDGIDDTGSAFLRRRMLEVGNRASTLNSVSEYVQGGLRGNLGSSVEYDLYASRGSVESTDSRSGALSRSSFNQSLLLDLQADPEGGVCQDSSSNANGVACTPANIFGPGNVSEEAADFLRVNYGVNSAYEQSTYGARLTGKLGSLAGGQARITVGAEHREDRYQQEAVTDGADIGDVAGIANIPSYSGETSSDSIYGDIYLPLAAGADGAELADLELGYRLTDHSTAPDVASYGAALSFAPTEFFKIRAAYNQAYRAPNIGELFLPQSEGFPGANDPCSASGAPAGGLTPEQAATCIATGVPQGSVGTPAINPASGQVRAISGGNPELEAEQAETFSAGLEIALPVGDSAMVRLGGDYFTINGTDAIGPFGGGAANVLNVCYSADNSQGADSPFCEVINRNSDGTIESVELTSQNEAAFEVEGVDLFAGVSLPVMGGSLGLNFNGTLLDTHSFTAFEGADSLECAGRFGNACGQPLPEYSHRVTAGWTTDNLTAAVIWRHVGEVTDDNDANTFFVEKIGARDYLDAELSLDFADSIGLSVGVQNLTDVAPPIIGDNQGNANTYPGTYDVFGRTYFVRVTGSSSLDGE